MEDVLVGLVVIVVVGQGAGQPEGYLIADIMVGGSAPSGGTGGVVLLQDGLLQRGNALLGVHRDVPVAGGVQHDQGAGVGAICQFGLGDEVVALGYAVEGLVGRSHICRSTSEGLEQCISKRADVAVTQAADVGNQLVIAGAAVLICIGSIAGGALEHGPVLGVDGVGVVVAVVRVLVGVLTLQARGQFHQLIGGVGLAVAVHGDVGRRAPSRRCRECHACGQYAGKHGRIDILTLHLNSSLFG